MRLFFIVLMALSILSVTCFAGQLYKWIDEDGGLHYSDRHPGSLENLRDFENLSYPDSKPQAPEPRVEHRLDPPGEEVTIDPPQAEQVDEQRTADEQEQRDDDTATDEDN